jgi:hypothetical protein
MPSNPKIAIGISVRNKGRMSKTTDNTSDCLCIGKDERILSNRELKHPCYNISETRLSHGGKKGKAEQHGKNNKTSQQGSVKKRWFVALRCW